MTYTLGLLRLLQSPFCISGSEQKEGILPHLPMLGWSLTRNSIWLSLMTCLWAHLQGFGESSQPPRFVSSKSAESLCSLISSVHPDVVEAPLLGRTQNHCYKTPAPGHLKSKKT